jgi:hypothetical protein
VNALEWTSNVKARMVGRHRALAVVMVGVSCCLGVSFFVEDSYVPLNQDFSKILVVFY